MDAVSPEPFVAAERAAEFLSVRPRYLLNLARRGVVPAYPLGSGPRKVWRFRLSELSRALTTRTEHNLASSLPRPKGDNEWRVDG